MPGLLGFLIVSRIASMPGGTACVAVHRSNPHSPSAHLLHCLDSKSRQYLGSYHLCRYREAVYSFQAAVRVQTADPLAHFRIGNALFALKKYADARKVGQSGGVGGGIGCWLVRLCPDEVRAVCGKGRIHAVACCAVGWNLHYSRSPHWVVRK